VERSGQPLIPGRSGAAAGAPFCSFGSAVAEFATPGRQASPFAVSSTELSKVAGAGGRSPIIRGTASMQQVADWLDKLGMSEYASQVLCTPEARKKFG